MKKVKNVFILLLSVLMVIGLVGCDNSVKEQTPEPPVTIVKSHTTESVRDINDPIVITSLYAKGNTKYIAIKNISDKAVDLDGYKFVNDVNMASIVNPEHPDPTIIGLSNCTNSYFDYGSYKDVTYDLKKITLNPGVTLYLHNITDLNVPDLKNFKNLPAVDAKTADVIVEKDSRLFLNKIAEWNGNDPSKFMKDDTVIVELKCDTKKADRKTDAPTLQEVKTAFDKAVAAGESTKKFYDKYKEVNGCPLKNTYYVRNFSEDMKKALSWDAYNLYFNSKADTPEEKVSNERVDLLVEKINSMFPAEPTVE